MGVHQHDACRLLMPAGQRALHLCGKRWSDWVSSSMYQASTLAVTLSHSLGGSSCTGACIDV